MIGAVVAILAGLEFALTPAQLLSGFGFNAPTEALAGLRCERSSSATSSSRSQSSS